MIRDYFWEALVQKEVLFVFSSEQVASFLNQSLDFINLWTGLLILTCYLQHFIQRYQWIRQKVSQAAIWILSNSMAVLTKNTL